MRFLESLASSYIIICVDELSYIFLWRLNPSAVSPIIPCASAHRKSIFMSMEVHSLSIPFMSAIGLKYAMLRGFFFMGL